MARYQLQRQDDIVSILFDRVQTTQKFSKIQVKVNSVFGDGIQFGWLNKNLTDNSKISMKIADFYQTSKGYKDLEAKMKKILKELGYTEF